MHRFDYSFLNERVVDSDMLNRALKIQEFRIRMKGIMENTPLAFNELESLAKIQSVKGSNAIEGIITSDERITAIVNKNMLSVYFTA